MEYFYTTTKNIKARTNLQEKLSTCNATEEAKKDTVQSKKETGRENLKQKLPKIILKKGWMKKAITLFQNRGKKEAKTNAEAEEKKEG
ncbi:hypothetical protein L1887_05042 [Cichorium endivia]|nr:hypothetical protein L1887_05042 [Cichorium endivia]